MGPKELNRSATWQSTRSPIWCPNVSLICLKSSRSMKTKVKDPDILSQRLDSDCRSAWKPSRLRTFVRGSVWARLCAVSRSRSRLRSRCSYCLAWPSALLCNWDSSRLLCACALLKSDRVFLRSSGLATASIIIPRRPGLPSSSVIGNFRVRANVPSPISSKLVLVSPPNTRSSSRQKISTCSSLKRVVSSRPIKSSRPIRSANAWLP